MPQGGRREGAGRPEGSRNRRTVEVEERAREMAAALAKAIPEAFDGDAHALLMLVYKDPAQPMELRLEAAGKASRYEKPALAAVDVTNHDVKFVVSGEPIDRDGEQWAVKFAGEPTEH